MRQSFQVRRDRFALEMVVWNLPMFHALRSGCRKDSVIYQGLEMTLRRSLVAFQKIPCVGNIVAIRRGIHDPVTKQQL